MYSISIRGVQRALYLHGGLEVSTRVLWQGWMIYVSELSAAGLQFALGASHGRGPPVVIEWFKAGPCALTSSTQVSTMFINFNSTSRAWWHLSQTRPPLRIKLPGPVRLQGQSSSLRVAGGRVFTPETKCGLFHHDSCLQLIHSEKRLPYRFAGYNSSL